MLMGVLELWRESGEVGGRGESGETGERRRVYVYVCVCG